MSNLCVWKIFQKNKIFILKVTFKDDFRSIINENVIVSSIDPQ